METKNRIMGVAIRKRTTIFPTPDDQAICDKLGFVCREHSNQVSRLKASKPNGNNQAARIGCYAHLKNRLW